MKVLQVARQFYPSMAGVERFTMDLCRHLIREGVRSDVLTLNRCFYMDGVLPRHESIEGIEVTRIPYVGGQRYFFAPSVLRHVADYDLLHVHNIDFFSDFLLLSKPYHRKPVVVSTHGGFFHTRRLAAIKEIYFRTITRFLLPSADLVIADSEHDREIFAPIIPNLRVIQNGVDYGRLADVRKQIQPGLLVYVGRLVSNKRIDHLIQCLALVRERAPNAQMVLVGPDYDEITEELRSLANTLNIAETITFTGQVSDAALADWLSRAHLFVTASEYEAFGISVLEAMSTRTVPVVNALESFQHFIQDGHNGFFVDYSKPSNAAQIIARLLKFDLEEINSLGQNAQIAAARYSWDNTVNHFVDIYRELIMKE